jgi:N-acetylglucosaminyl-diphospho-decaprenol L-rhamnosyltransferase
VTESRLSVFIPSFGNPKLAISVARDLSRVISPEVTITVRNDSNFAGEDEIIRRHLSNLPAVTIEQNPTNLGFGQNCNLGVEESESEFVWILNSDSRVSLFDAERALELFRVDPQLAILSHVSTGGNFNRATWGIPNQTSLSDLSHAFKLVGAEKASNLKILDASSLIVRRTAFLSLGGFDPLYGRGYFEDADLGLRAWGRGFRVGLDEKTLIHHIGTQSFGKEKAQLMNQNRVIFEKRWGKRETLWQEQFVNYPVSIADEDFLLKRSEIPAVVNAQLRSEGFVL